MRAKKGEPITWPPTTAWPAASSGALVGRSAGRGRRGPRRPAAAFELRASGGGRRAGRGGGPGREAWRRGTPSRCVDEVGADGSGRARGRRRGRAGPWPASPGGAGALGGVARLWTLAAHEERGNRDGDGSTMATRLRFGAGDVRNRGKQPGWIEGSPGAWEAGRGGEGGAQVKNREGAAGDGRNRPAKGARFGPSRRR
ncbi:hypothetical protein PVAP13_9NG135446 [Panicum virgatum]|uniref:Uncharacterized protein n=1 Tax=Panicum virgatum TaxID=38727 RepID=A0A8T0MM04_PANVG|nr:hypothetical protein PVAP13_9NG135446 [Panicum virgatum]